MKKVLALALAVLMLLPILVACNSGDNGNVTTAKPNTTTQPTPGVTTPTVSDTDPSTPGNSEPGATNPPATNPPTTTPPAAELPEVDYTGTTFRVISQTNADTATSWGNYEIVYNEEALLVATELKTAIKNRNDALKEKIGVEISQIDGKNHSTMFTTVRTSVARNQNEYDMVIIRTKEAAQLAQKGYLASVQDDLTYMNIDQDYYDQRAKEQLSIKGKNYFFVSDITVVNIDAVWLYYFNHDLITEYELENPYTILSEGKWTIDKLLEMAETATSDDGDGNPTKTDNWGIAGHGFVPTSMFFGAGMTIAKEDAATGKITLTMNDTRITEFMEKATKILPYWARYSIHGSGDTYGFVSGDNYPQLVEMYAAGRTLFMGEVLAFSRDTSLAATGEELNIGMLPTPKLNEAQAEYYTPVTSSVATVTCIPATACGNKASDGEGLKKASAIVEYWAKESQNTVMKTYMEQCQKSRYSKDEISAEVIEDIFAAVAYDLGDAFGWGNLTQELQKILYEGDTDFASMYKSKSPKAQSDIDDFLKVFK